jgi:bifunctional NMN adenylyltransferase/nudix hydrolase
MSLSFLEGVCAPSTIHFLHEFRKTENYHQLMREKRYIEDYQKQFSGLAYAPTFVTADAVVFQSGYVLLVKRKAEPGKGLLALPGGFLNASTDESLEDAAIRELYEETSINLPEKVLRKNIKNVKVFDAISRSARGRTITHAYNIVLDDGEWNLPKIKGGDDAEEVGTDWYPINNLDRSELFEDHYDIIKFFIGKI